MGFLSFSLLAITWLGPGVAVKSPSQKHSSLFQAWAMSPYPPSYYPYPPYYGPYPQMQPVYDQPGFMINQSPPQQAPQYFYPPGNQYPQYPPPQQYMAASPASTPPVTYYQAPPPQVKNIVMAPPAPVPQQQHDDPQPRTVLKVDVPDTRQSSTQPSPIKEALQKELDKAAKALDNIAAHAPDLSQFDNLAWKPVASSNPVEQLSLAQDPVPLDTHILNWRKLVGLPPNDPVGK